MLLAMTGSLLDRHLLYITGKGGTGKTTVAAALGIAAAARGRRTIVVEVAPPPCLDSRLQWTPSPLTSAGSSPA